MAGISRRQIMQLAIGGSLCLSGRAAAVTRGVDQSGFVRIGGIDQWIAVQGRDTRNPAILYLHGGPGEAQSPFLRDFFSWERDFTVANWDQRGAGKTYGRNGPSTPDMTLDRLIDDAIEVAQQVCARLSRRKLILVGQSWGSFLGVHVIKRRPELFHAFVGTGQVVSFAANVTNRVRYARQEATAVGDQATLKALKNAAELPAGRRAMAELDASRRYRFSPQDRSYAKMMYDFMGWTDHRPKRLGTAVTKEKLSNLLRHAKGDVANWIAGAEFSGSKLETVVTTMNLRRLGLDMPIPFFVIQGREDHITSFQAARTYVEDIRAPTKAFIPIDGGHFACFTNADQFVSVLRKRVRPLAT